MSFKNIRAGDRVKFLDYAGGNTFVERIARVNPLLIFPDHVVVNHGGRVVNSSNYISHITPKPRAERGSRNADRIDGFDRDDLGFSPDY